MDRLEKEINKLKNELSVYQYEKDKIILELGEEKISILIDTYNEFKVEHTKIVSKYIESEAEYKRLKANIAIFLYKNKKTFKPYLNIE